METGVQIVLGSAAFVFILCRAQLDNMCASFVTQTANTNFTFTYQPGNDTCCCTVRLGNNNTNITISSNVTYFLLVPPSGTPIQNLRNGTHPRFGNHTILCAKGMPQSTETGTVNILGDEAFNSRCGMNNSVNIVPVQVTITTGKQSPTNSEKSTSTEPSGTANIKRTPTAFPSSSTSTAHTMEPVKTVLWIVIGSVAGGLIIIIGIIICVCVKRKQRSNNNLYAQQDSVNPAYSLARVQGPLEPVLESRSQETDNGNELLMAENCLYNHDVGHKVDTGTNCDSNVHSQESYPDDLYAKVNKTSRISE